MFRSFLAAVIAVFISIPAYAAPEIGKPAPDFTGTDYLGSSVKLSQFKGRIVVLEWTNPKCPFVKKHYESGNMQRLQQYARGKNVAWLSINSSAVGKEGYMDAGQAVLAFEQAPPASLHYILDPKGEIGNLYEAKTTPHMFVINGEGTLVYMGAIDDKATTDQADIATAKNYVQTAIDSISAGTPVAVASTQAYGCAVKY